LPAHATPLVDALEVTVALRWRGGRSLGTAVQRGGTITVASG
jgi:hypothetical protein